MKNLIEALNKATSTQAIQEIAEQILIKELEEQNSNSDIDFAYHVANLSIDFEKGNIEEIIEEELNEQGAFDVEFIGYYKACQFLLENDCSLKDSLELAQDMGYSCNNLSSEILASLLASDMERDEYSFDFSDSLEEIQEAFNALGVDDEE